MDVLGDLGPKTAEATLVRTQRYQEAQNIDVITPR